MRIEGHVAAGWGAVADAFRDNFDAGTEVGAACCVYADGEPVVDVWAGTADRRTGRPWTEDTVALVMSATKGATAICANRLADRGALDLDAPVEAYWPEFAANGKEGVIVRWLLAHKAGLPVVERPLTAEEACAWAPVVEVLAAQTPLWTPGMQHCYHALTYGFLVGEVVRRATGRTVGAVFADEVAAPLGLQAWIGQPEAVEDRVAPLLPYEIPDDPQISAMVEQFMGLDSLTGRAISLGGAVPTSMVTEDGGFNARIMRTSEWPAANMVADARSVARMYAATIGEVEGVRLLSKEAVADATTSQTAGCPPFGLPPGMEAAAMQFGVGFVLPSPMVRWVSPSSFGHPGAGGSVGFADPDYGVGFGYVVNQMRLSSLDRRSTRIVDAVRRVVGAA